MTTLTPWAREGLTPEQQRLVRDAGISVSAKSPRGPWIAWGPAFPRFGAGDEDADTRWVGSIERAVNRAAGYALI